MLFRSEGGELHRHVVDRLQVDPVLAPDGLGEPAPRLPIAGRIHSPERHHSVCRVQGGIRSGVDTSPDLLPDLRDRLRELAVAIRGFASIGRASEG